MEFNITAMASIDPWAVILGWAIFVAAVAGTVRYLSRILRPFTLLPGRTRLLPDHDLKALDPLLSIERDIEPESRR